MIMISIMYYDDTLHNLMMLENLAKCLCNYMYVFQLCLEETTFNSYGNIHFLDSNFIEIGT